MEIKTLYRYEREPGKYTVATEKPDCDYEERYRIIADEGKVLVKDEVKTACIDVDSTDGWGEIDASDEPEETTQEEYAEAGRILLGVSE